MAADPIAAVSPVHTSCSANVDVKHSLLDLNREGFQHQANFHWSAAVENVN